MSRHQRTDQGRRDAGADRPAAPIRVEEMRGEDVDAVLRIEALAFSTPWTREMFLQEAQRPDISRIFVARLGGAGEPGAVAGYLCLWVVGDELHINNVAVDPAFRRQGIASRLLEAALEHGRRRGARRAVLEVRSSNVAAQALYRRYGFAPIAVRRRYYSRPTEDALVMRKDGV